MKKKPVVVCFGLPGSGKSYLGERLSKELDLIYLSSDILRKEMKDSPDYSESSRDEVYELMFETLEGHLSTNSGVLLDATFGKAEWRDMVFDMCTAFEVDCHFIELIADESDILKRTSAKRAYSDANFDVYRTLKDSFEDMPEKHLVLNSSEYGIDDLIQMSKKYLKI